MFSTRLILLDIILFSLFLPSLVKAETQDWGWFLDFGVSFSSLASKLVLIIVSLAFIFFLWGVAIFILNAGDDKKREEGKKKMFWGAIALTVMVGVWGIVEFFLSAFGITESGVNLPKFPTEFPTDLP